MTADAERPVPGPVFRHYDEANEATRLHRGAGRLEFARTMEIVERYAPPPPAVVLDVGGGAGVYALPLAARGYEVHLLDLVPLHVEQAREASARVDRPLASTLVGDARDLDRDDASVDLVLLLGPLYHLTERDDRVAAWREAFRVLRPGGVVVAAVISRFASAMDGMRRWLIDDPRFVEIVDEDLRCGQHRNPTDHPDYFTTAYLHRPEEPAAEIGDAGGKHVATLAVEGPAWTIGDLEERWHDATRRERLLEILRRLESEPSLLGAHHLLAVGRRR